MAPHDLLRAFDALPGHLAVLRAVPGFPVVAMSRTLQAMSAAPAHVLGRPLFELFPEAPQAPGSAAILQAAFEHVIRTRRPERHEQRFDLVDPASGRFEERYWSMVNTPILDDAGAVEYILHQAEDAATERRHGSMAILDAMTEGVFTLDRQWRFGYVNPEAHRILRAEPGSLAGAVIWERFPGSGNSAFSEHYRQTMHGRVATRFTAFYPGLEGWYEVTVYPAPEGISVYFRDVTARVLAEQDRERLAAESKHQRRIYETALDNTPDFVYVFGTDHRAIYANQALLRVWGVDDVRGKTWLDLGYEPWHADMHDRELAEVIATRAPIRGEIPFTGTNGRRIYDYIFAPVFDAAGAIVAVAGTTRDITERQAAERIIREHAQRLAEADRAKDDFLATLSHELRNPLAPIRYGLEILRASTESGGQQARIHSMMERQVDHLVRLVDDLMEVSRITRGKVSLQVEPVTLADVVDSAIEASRPAIEAGQHGLTLDLPATPVVVHGDRVRLAQILGNLLNNAARYSAPGGHVVLRARVADGAVILSVEDSGVGMEAEEIPRLFEMFSRGERTRASHQGGLGIGLALARRLAVLHGGSLDAVSDGPGKGSTFTLRLPLHGTDAAPSSWSDDIDTTRLLLRVLVADDEADVGGSLAEALRLSGAEVHLVENGGDALREFDRIEPDVAILDIGMPHVTGYDVARTLRERGVRTPLIALTGWGQAEDRERAFAAGFDHHLVKPVAMPMLVDLLASIEHATRATAVAQAPPEPAATLVHDTPG
ncbi:response regulator [Luteimonas yindakuii]|uniref:histidine kinase n=1 Tax=Luteimonas yindakuii TaxID=2565782 RepID=A0A4Z1RDJ5_9GAMM|nr:PAS domain-containing protein [Luteimonas yindakuii]TKS54898.1 response regulator [Luteimonas yindakuii]